MPNNIALGTTIARVFCFCKLHNFCIDRPEGDVGTNALDCALQIADNGGVPLDDANGNPYQLLHAGNHYEDVDRSMPRHMEGISGLPRDKMLEIIYGQPILLHQKHFGIKSSSITGRPKLQKLNYGKIVCTSP